MNVSFKQRFSLHKRAWGFHLVAEVGVVVRQTILLYWGNMRRLTGSSGQPLDVAVTYHDQATTCSLEILSRLSPSAIAQLIQRLAMGWTVRTSNPGRSLWPRCWGVGLWTLDCWICGFESLRRHRCLCCVEECDMRTGYKGTQWIKRKEEGKSTNKNKNAGGGENFHTHPDCFQGPASLLYSGYQVSFPGVKRPGRDDHPPPSGAEVNAKVELYFCPALGHHGLY
jgi:hypothetical protein